MSGHHSPECHRPPATPPLISALTGIRALAAGWVVIGHLWEVLTTLLPGLHVADSIVSYGYLGPDVFFVLSGFIISYNYAERFVVLDPSRYRHYLRARFARVYPVHLLSFLVVAALVAWVASLGSTMNPAQHYTLVGGVGNLLMLQALPGIEAWNVPAWSISCEFAAYLAFPFLAGFLVSRGRGAALVLAALLGAALVGGVGLLVATGTFLPLPLYWLRIATEFVLGGLLWSFWRHGVRRSPRWDGVAAAMLIVTAAVFVIVRPSIALSFVTVPLLAVFVLATASASGPIGRFLASRPMEWGGRVSYSLYLMHFPVLLVLFLFLPFRDVATGSLASRAVVAAVYVGLPLVVATATYYVVEEPARRWLRGRGQSASPPEASTATHAAPAHDGPRAVSG